MKHIIAVLSTIGLMAVGASPATEAGGAGVRLRYGEMDGRVSVAVSHEIEIRADHIVQARREFSFELSLAADADAVRVVVDDARGSNEAHGMKQRLGARHLRGRALALSREEGGRVLAVSADPDEPAIDLGPMVPGGVSLSALLDGILPVLPEEPVAEGATWRSERPVRSLEGWAWGAGTLDERHRVLGIDAAGGREVVSVETKATGLLGPVEGGRAYSGELTRTVRWSFEASSGRLLSLSLEQETEGTSALGRADTPIHQKTVVEWAPSTREAAP